MPESSRLLDEWQRLFGMRPNLLADAADAAVSLCNAQGQVRALVLEVGRPAQWSLLQAVWVGVQTDLGWPAPAIAVSGEDRYQLWMPLAAPVDAAQAARCLAALSQRYLPDVAAPRVRWWPAAGTPEGAHVLTAVPCARRPGHWSAFVAPDLAPVFEDTPWLDTPPGEEAQAGLLARIAPMPAADFHQALQRLGLSVAPADAAPAPDEVTTGPASVAGTTALEPAQANVLAQRFLLDVMQDAATPLRWRIEAAKALLGSGRG